MRKLPKSKKKGENMNVRINENFYKLVKQRAKELDDMDVSSYVTACLIFDIRYGDVTEHIKELQKNFSIAYSIFPSPQKPEYEEQMIKFREKKTEA